MRSFLSRAVLLLLPAHLVTGGPAAAEQSLTVETVTMVQDAGFPPYMMQTPSGPGGIYAEIIREVDRRLPGYQIELQALPWSRALHLVASGRIKTLLGTYQRPKQRPWLRQYSKVITYESLFVYCRKGVADKTWSFPDDYAGLVFGNNSGFETPGPAFFDLVAAGRIFLNEEQTTELNLKLLQYGRADCYVQDKSVVDPLLSTGLFDMIEPVKQLTYETTHVGFSEAWDAQQADRFKQELDRVLEEMKQDGSLDSITFQNLAN